MKKLERTKYETKKNNRIHFFYKYIITCNVTMLINWFRWVIKCIISFSFYIFLHFACFTNFVSNYYFFASFSLYLSVSRSTYLYACPIYPLITIYTYKLLTLFMRKMYDCFEIDSRLSTFSINLHSCSDLLAINVPHFCNENTISWFECNSNITQWI